MSAFTDRLTVTEVELASYHWELVTPLVYEVGALGSGRTIVVPAGFISDGATIPPIVVWFLPRWGRWRRAGVVHDYLYELLGNGTPHVEGADRLKADNVFLEALAVAGVSLPVRWTFYAAVRLFGGFHVASD